MKRNIITFTSSKMPYGWMGNMAGYKDGKALTINYDNKLWKTSENLFQALRFTDIGIQGLIRKEGGFDGKKIAKRFTEDMTVTPLSEQDVKNMILCIRLKTNQHGSIKKELLKTKNSIIIEDVSFRPEGTGMFWGSSKLSYHWIGHNILGKIWMFIREEFKGVIQDEEKFIKLMFSEFVNSDYNINNK